MEPNVQWRPQECRVYHSFWYFIYRWFMTQAHCACRTQQHFPQLTVALLSHIRTDISHVRENCDSEILLLQFYVKPWVNIVTKDPSRMGAKCIYKTILQLPRRMRLELAAQVMTRPFRTRLILSVSIRWKRIIKLLRLHSNAQNAECQCKY